MIKKLKEMAKDKNNLLILVLAGVLLMVIALPLDNGKKTENGGENGDSTSGKLNNESYDMEENSAWTEGLQYTDSAGEYTEAMEQKVAALLMQMEGAGEVRVIITLRTSAEKVVEKDAPVSRTDTEEADSGGGTRRVNAMDTGDSTVYTNEGNYSEPYVIKTISPQIEGVVVLAEGAGSGSVSKNISDIIQVLFGIDAHQVKVVKLKN